MKKRTLFGLLGVSAVAGATAAGSAAALGALLYQRIMVTTPRDPDKEDHLTAQHEGRLWARQGEGFSHITITNEMDLILSASCISNADNHRWVICIHGYHDSSESMGIYARHYSEEGWNVLLPDQRGYGNSQGDHIGWGYDERLDLLEWVNYITRRDPEAQIVLHGVSMGAATALMLTGDPVPAQVKAVISDCCYTSAEAIMKHVYHTFLKEKYSMHLPFAPVFSMIRKTALRRAGLDIKDASPIEAVSRSKTPTLFIHGVDDEFVPASMMGKLYQAARCPKQFLWVEHAAHTESVAVDPQLYWKTVDLFLDTYL